VQNAACKIAFVCPLYPPSHGGTQVLLHTLGKELRAGGARVDVFTTGAASSDQLWDPPLRRAVPGGKEMMDGIHVHRSRIGGLSWLCRKVVRRICSICRVRPPCFLTSLPLFGIASGLLRCRPDVIVVATMRLDLAHTVTLVSRLLKSRTAIFPGLHLAEQGAHEALKQHGRILAQFKKVLVYTEYERRYLLELGLDPADVVTVGVAAPAPVPETEIQPLPDELVGSPYAVYVGRFVQRKGIETLLAAQQLVDGRFGLKVVLAGAPSLYFSSVLKPQLAQRRGVLVFEDPTEALKQRLIADAKVLCMVSSSESFGIAYLEAWQQRVPAIGACGGAVSCVIDDGVDGFLVPWGDAAALACRLEFLLENETERVAMGEAGYRKQKERFSPSAVAARVAAALSVQEPAV